MLSLVADYGSESSNNSNSESDPSDNEEKLKLKIETASSFEKLPTPDFDGSSNKVVKTSVFSNPFIEAENAKKAILEKHVKMVNNKDKINIINGKKICWNYRKGRCRFGHKCTFAHDSDVQKSKEDLKDVHLQQMVMCSTSHISEAATSNLQQNEEKPALHKKKRPGLSQTIIPGQKVMKLYHKEKLKDLNRHQ